MGIGKKRILVTDDSADAIRFIMDYFPENYDIMAATSGEKALKLATKEPYPDVILMDVDMPGMNGYETCRQLKQIEDIKDIDVIFVSSHDTVEEKLAGYDAGGCDYLTKPVDRDELLKKVKLSIDNHTLRTTSKSEKFMAMEIAMNALSTAEESSVIINFTQNNLKTNSLEDLAVLFLKTTSSLGLTNTIQINTGANFLYKSSKARIFPLEQELLEKLDNQEKVIAVNNRLILSFGHIAQIITNMPDDKEKCQRLQEHMTVLIKIADARVKNLLVHKELLNIINISNSEMLKIESMQNKQIARTEQIMDNLILNMEDAFLSYGLTESQEQGLMAMIEESIEQSKENIEDSKGISLSMNVIISHLSKVKSL
ncbi:MAG: response regulator [Gammaproteobacteria bacterium]|nr:response regulator [Gammaproteobacteria bacterium]